MSIRQSYYYRAERGLVGGPFKSIREAKEALSQDARISTFAEVTIRAVVALESRDRDGYWRTLH